MATESERSFAYLLPSSWVVRKQEDDYGIDAEVEIFEDGRTTGVTFKVQLKGSDTNRRSRSISVETLEYWRSLDVPVLVVFYEASTEQLYGRWAHAHDLHVGRELQVPRSTTFRFGDEDRLSRSILETRFLQDVLRFRDIRNGSLVEPLTYAVEFSDVPSAERRHLALRRLLDSAPLRTSRVPTASASLHIRCSPTELRVTGPAGLASLTAEIDLSVSPEQQAADIVAAMGFVLASLGAGVHAVNLFVVAGRSRLLHTFQVAATAGTCLGATGRHADAIRLSRPLIRDPEPTVRDAGNLILALAITGSMVPESVGDDLLRLDQDLIEIEMAQGKDHRAAVAYYNHGEHLASVGQCQAAIAAYTAAAHLEPRYLGFDYYHRELGGLYWLRSDYEASAAAYGRALQNGGDPSQLTPLLADALLLSGRYQDAIDLLTDWDPTGSPSSALAELVSTTADLVVRTTGLKQQVRRDPMPDEEVPVSDPWLCRQRLIDFDALDSRYWLVATDTLPDEDELAYSALLAHLSNEPRFWAIATCTAYRLKSPLVNSLVGQAYRRCEESYLAVMDFLAESDDDGAGEPWFGLSRDEIAAHVDEVHRQLAMRPDSRPSPVLRLLPPSE